MSTVRLLGAPQLSVTYKPNAHWNFTTAYSYSEQPKDGLELCQTPLFTDYLMQRIGSLYANTLQRLL